MENAQEPLQDVAVYKSFLVKGAAAKFQRDLKKRQKQGWRLISCTQKGWTWLLNPIFIAIYEK
jgi:hypothetical protein